VASDPLYRRIADDLRRQIEDGSLAPGNQLGTEPELGDKYRASRNTVRDAIKWLISRGLVESRPGQGTFVVEKITPFVTTLSGDPQTGFGGGDDNVYRGKEKIKEREAQRTRVEVQQADAMIAGELQLKEGDTVVSRHQSVSLKETPDSPQVTPEPSKTTPWSLQTSFYPMSLVENGALRLIQAPDIKEGTVKYLAETLGIKQAGWRDTITVRTPDEIETAFFKLPADGRVSVIETRRTAFNESGQPVRLTVTVYPADQHQFAVNVGRVPRKVSNPAGEERPDAAETEPSGSQSSLSGNSLTPT
jgi:GntR family transcriptional regulator